VAQLGVGLMSFNANEFRQQRHEAETEKESSGNKGLVIMCSLMAVATAGVLGYPKVKEFRSERVAANQMFMAEAEDLSSQRKMEREIKARNSGLGQVGQGLVMRRQAMSQMEGFMAEHRIGAEPRKAQKRVPSEPRDIDEILNYSDNLVGNIARYQMVKRIARTCEKNHNFPVNTRANYMRQNNKALTKINKMSEKLKAEAAAKKKARLKGKKPAKKMELDDIQGAGDYFKWRMQGGSPTNMAMDNMSGMMDMMEGMDDFESGNRKKLPKEASIPSRAAMMMTVPQRSRRTSGWSSPACNYLVGKMNSGKYNIKA